MDAMQDASSCPGRFRQARGHGAALSVLLLACFAAPAAAAANFGFEDAGNDGAPAGWSVRGDGYEAVEGKFSAIVLNPPIRTGKEVIYSMFADALNHLTDTGALYIVIRKQQGAESAQKYLKTIYAGVERISREKGYWVLRCAMMNADEEQ